METTGIVPDFIDKAPKSLLKVVYAGNHLVNNGAELTPTLVKDAPTIEFGGNANKLYTLLMTDLDAHPSKDDPLFGEVVHWLVVNIPGNDINKGEVIAEYIGSGPRKDTGAHKYMFLVFEQPGHITADEPRSSRTSARLRLKFITKNFVAKYKLGAPIAGNFYRAQYDDYVPILYQQFKE